jgi:polyhydroxyalkanoate synthase subunit PhaC
MTTQSNLNEIHEKTSLYHTLSGMKEFTTKERFDDISKGFLDFWYKWYDFVQQYNIALFDATSKSLESFLNLADTPYQKMQNSIRSTFDSTLRGYLKKERFASTVADVMDASVRIADLTGYATIRSRFNDFFLSASRLLEPIRDSINRTPSEVIIMKGRFSLLHYKCPVQRKHKTPVLVVYSLINRHYILDLMPKFSIIKSLLKQGLDVYATDWGTPDSSYKDLTLDDYAHEYVENAVEKIKEISGTDKVSLFGYCWGGIFALIYSALYPQNVKNLILHATPIDLEQTNEVVENWAKHIDADKLVKAYGNIPGGFLNLAFVLRDPIDTVLKYPRYFSEPRSIDEIVQFFSIETWLYDSVPIIGDVYKEIVDQVYKQNLLIKSKMKVGSDIVDLQKITMPFLDIVGSNDDLVPPESSKTIMDVIPSTDKKLIEFPTGHVGLCVSQKAHDQLWPEVGRWLAQRS